MSGNMNVTLTGGETETLSGDFNGHTITLSGDGTFDFSHDANGSVIIVEDAGVTVNIAHDFNGSTLIADTIKNGVPSTDLATVVHDANGSHLLTAAGTVEFGHDANGASGDFIPLAVAAGSGIFNVGHDANGSFFEFGPTICYAAGTRILTARGEVAVEELRVGDLVVTLLGKGAPLKPVRWIGERRVDMTAHPSPDQMRPIRIAADAFGDGMPVRDLVVSPDHSLFVDGVLINARKLVNGVSVAQDRACSAVRYFHIELDEHDILLADGMPAESYLDTGNRSQFGNGPRLVVLHPDFAPKQMQTDACAPFVEAGPQLAAVRRRLIDRLAAQGWELSDDPELALLVDGRAVRAESVAGGVYRFQLPEDLGELRLLSRSYAPGGVSPDKDDMRRLGVCVGGLALTKAGYTKEVAVEDPAFADGFHAAESSGGLTWRWTDGDARLPEALVKEAAGATLEVRLLWPGSYWVAPGEPEPLRATA